MNASAACLRGSLLVRRTVLSISLTGNGTSFTDCCRLFATEACSELVPNLSALFPNVARCTEFTCSARRGHAMVEKRNLPVQHHYSRGGRFALSKHCSESTIPKLGSDTVVSVRKPVMVEMMFQQGSRQNCRIVMGAIMDK